MALQEPLFRRRLLGFFLVKTLRAFTTSFGFSKGFEVLKTDILFETLKGFLRNHVC